MITVNFTTPVYISLADRPSAPVFGMGTCIAAGVLYSSDGVTWTDASSPAEAVDVAGTPLTGFTAEAGTVAATDTVLEAIEKLDGNVALKADASAVSGTFTAITSITITNGVVTAISGT